MDKEIKLNWFCHNCNQFTPHLLIQGHSRKYPPLYCSKCRYWNLIHWFLIPPLLNSTQNGFTPDETDSILERAEAYNKEPTFQKRLEERRLSPKWGKNRWLLYLLILFRLILAFLVRTLVGLISVIQIIAIVGIPLYFIFDRHNYLPGIFSLLLFSLFRNGFIVIISFILLGVFREDHLLFILGVSVFILSLIRMYILPAILIQASKLT